MGEIFALMVEESTTAAAPEAQESAVGEGTSEPEMRSVVVLSKAMEVGTALNATAHLSAGLAGLMARNDRLPELAFNDYHDQQGGVYPSVSDHPFIVLKAKPAHLRSLRADLEAQGMLHTVFLDTMLMGIATFGESAAIRGLT